VLNKIRPLTFKEFQDFLADILEVDPELLKPQAYFVTDLGVDSLKLTEMLLQFQALGLELSPNLAWLIQTVGEAYQYYQEQAASDP
jgi:acyl carrier protein